MITLKAAPRMRYCRITQTTFALTDSGRVIQQELQGIHRFYEAFKLGQYQIMPDHVHFLAHVVAPLPDGATLRTVVRAFKIGVKRCVGYPVFAAGMYDSLIFDRKQLETEVAYVRANVFRYRQRQANPTYFQEARALPPLPGCRSELIGFGNPSLLTHPRRVAIRISDRITPEEWRETQADVAWWIEQGYVFVSPFISKKEVAVRDTVLAKGGRLIRMTYRPFGKRYKPSWQLINACSAGRVLEISAAREFPPETDKITRAICLRLNELAVLASS
ncbi:MAG: hypothetical protein RBR06_11600 [Desulfuromonadaceae bacterium]|nr:hypothetical protein [Desulfuromonadaceae bacterium]